jgi:hypothetical protein
MEFWQGRQMGRKPKTQTLPQRYTPGFIVKMDQRCMVSLRMTTAYANIVADCGGEDQITHIKAALIERFVFLEATLQAMEAEIAKEPLGPRADVMFGRVVQAGNALNGLAKQLGIERRAKQVENLREFLDARKEDTE